MPSLGMLSQWVSSNEPFDVNSKVVDFILPSGEWNQDLLKQYFPLNVLSTISLVSTNLDDPCDLITWSGSADGTFTIKSAIHSLHQDPDSSHAPLFKKVWSWVGPQRIRAFLWLLANEALLSNSNRARRHMTNNDLCPICNQIPETNLHPVRDCAWAKQIWIHFIPLRHHREFFHLNLFDWILYNLSFMCGTCSQGSWPLTFGFVTTGIWHGRNAFLFDNSPINVVVICSSVRRQINEAAQVFFPSQQRMLGDNNVDWVRWQPPEISCIKVNADGAFTTSTHHGACGGVFRNHDGKFISAYIHYLPNSSPLEAELLGILKGLLHAWNNSFRKLIVEVDSMHAIQIIGRGCSPMYPYFKVVQEIQLLLRRSWTMHIQHVMREANHPAHMLATHGFNQINSDCIFRIVPSFLSLSLAADVMGTWFPRNS
ncbi:Ribonuclease H domain [Sesbania bispinosa]|nr:Ribonuclease H domain [Sesbania bispinosa]